MEWFSATKNNEVMSTAGKWMQKEVNMISQYRQEKCFFSFLIPRLYVNTHDYVCIYDMTAEENCLGKHR